jgi:hypothetical protein
MTTKCLKLVIIWSGFNFMSTSVTSQILFFLMRQQWCWNYKLHMGITPKGRITGLKPTENIVRLSADYF